VVIPVKRLSIAKQRLTPALGQGRQEFAYQLALHTINVVRASGKFARIAVVSPDCRIHALANDLGIEAIDDHGIELNEACVLGLALAAERGADLTMLLPSDLATLTGDELSKVIDRFLRMRDREGTNVVGLVRCKGGSGTNLVLVNSRRSFTPAFGSDSFAQHMRSSGDDARELYAPSVSFDIDTPADLELYSKMVRHPDLLWSCIRNIRRATRVSTRTRHDTNTDILTKSLGDLMSESAALRDSRHGSLVTYSRKVFLPLTQLCRDSCHYCTFAKSPRKLRSPYMTMDEVLAVAAKGSVRGCKEALFTLGDRPEARYRVAAEWLAHRKFKSTLEYLGHVAAEVRKTTGLLPHINAGSMTAAELAMLRPVSASMGLMLESVAQRLCEKGGPHHGSPDKAPAVRLQTIAEAGRQKIPFTTGILIGIGETREERIDALRAIDEIHQRYGHIQEVIIQNFVPKAGTIMADAAPLELEELLWTVSVARLILGPEMSIQAPPNLSPASLPLIIGAGINDWGGISPLTPDYVNPEAPWPEIEDLQRQTASAGKILVERLTIYPGYAKLPDVWLDPAMRRAVLEQSDGNALGREDTWRAGISGGLPQHLAGPKLAPNLSGVADILIELRQVGAQHLTPEELASLFNARGYDFQRVCVAANELREETNGNVLTFVVNRNINYTNVCGYHCSFCAFSKGTRNHVGAERGYLLNIEEIVRRSLEARANGATEVCLQGGIHPSFTGETYIDILRAIKAADPDMHVHAFSPLEIWHGASTLGMQLEDYLSVLRREGLGSLPGTAAEVLVDSVRKRICPDKLNSEQWLQVMEAAHSIGLRTTSTIMFGHVDSYSDWASHLLSIRQLQLKTKGFTEFVPLPFVAQETPIYKQGQARPGPTLREAILMHAVARLALFPVIENIQTSWVKMGRAGIRQALLAGANDLGGTLMNESITRAAGATHGQEMTSLEMRELAAGLGRLAVQRTTLYRLPSSCPLHPHISCTVQ